jgi:hypothetical protein
LLTLESGNPIRPNLNTNLDLSSMTISEILAAGGAKLFRDLSPGQRVGNAGRNILRSDGLNLVDFGIIKNTRLSENDIPPAKKWSSQRIFKGGGYEPDPQDRIDPV